ncbi:MAG: phosphate ABC transporter substrate-binding protein, partial [Brachybacterium sp.]|nr:phosphate ABC transporter substrate-binding protein [Brachybacterium sp.]
GNYLAAPEADRDRITTVAVGGVEPDLEHSVDGSYPLTRPLYLYVRVESLEENPAVEDYIRYVLDNGTTIMPRTYFYPLDEEGYDESLSRLEDRTTGPADS